MQLHDWQRDAVDRAKNALIDRPILVAPTGSGKTVMASTLVRELDTPTLWIAHRKELVDQAAAQLDDLGLSVGIIMAGYTPDPLMRVQVASLQTFVRRNKPVAQLIVIDECHHATADSYQTIFDCYPSAWVLGLTATPFRMSGRGLGDVFGELVVAATTQELVEDGYLHAPKIYSHSQPDLSNVRITAGDYNLRAANNAINRPKLVADIVETWQRLANGLKTIVFSTSIEHSKNIVEGFRAEGIAAQHLDGGTPRDERDAVLASLRDGRTTLVSNCMVLTEGWDLPALQCAVIARPTASLTLHLQMIGRIMRAAIDKEHAIVLDHAGNHHRHGAVTRQIDYDLSGVAATQSEPLGLKLCTDCYLMVPTGIDVCPECGHVFGTDPREMIETVGGKLVKFDESSFAYRQEYWEMLEQERQLMGFKEGWVAYRFKDRFGVWPVVVEERLINPVNATLEEKRSVFRMLEAIRDKKGYAPGWTSHRYRQIFGVWPRGVMGLAERLERQWRRRTRQSLSSR